MKKKAGVCYETEQRRKICRYLETKDLRALRNMKDGGATQRNPSLAARGSFDHSTANVSPLMECCRFTGSHSLLSSAPKQTADNKDGRTRAQGKLGSML